MKGKGTSQIVGGLGSDGVVDVTLPRVKNFVKIGIREVT